MSERTFYVFSTLASDVAYTNHAAGGADMPVDLPPVLIRGGAGVMNDRLITPQGVATEVTESQVAYLRENQVFLMHEKNGFVMISDKYTDPDKAAADLVGRDHSAPLVPQDATDDDETVVGGVKVEPDSAPKRSGGRPRKS